MGVTAARKARRILENCEAVAAIELLSAAQGRDFNSNLKAGKGAEAAHRALRGEVKAVGKDRYLRPDIESARQLIVSGKLVAATEKAAGKLEA